MAVRRKQPPDDAARPQPGGSRSGQLGGSSFRYGRPAGGPIEPDGRPSGQNAGWTLLGYLISGMTVYGGIGWLIARWTHLALLFPLGMLIGLGVAILLIVLKYGRT